jgi:hypothetical protein
MQSFAEQSPVVFHVARFADALDQRKGPKRDKQLWKFWAQEPLLAGAVYSMSSKVAALDFTLKGPRKSAARYKTVLLSADFGRGWVNFITKIVQDMFTQDNGGFIEIHRRENTGARAPVQGIAHLDSQKCNKTGDPEHPVVYRDAGGEKHKLAWYEVLPMTDMMSPREEDQTRGFCAVSRVLRAAQVLRDIGIYKRQKLSGKRVPAMIFVQGVRQGAIEEALQRQMTQDQQSGNTLYTSPAILASPDPGLAVDAQLIELAGLPDGYNEDTLYKWYIATLALCFGTDYTEFAPLPGGNLGSATQATIMASRARGKGPGVILQQFEFGINWYVLPQTVEFQFASTDPSAERERIELSLLRARERAIRLKAMELTPGQALRLAVRAGDAPESFLDEALYEDREEEIEQIVRSFRDAQETMQMIEKGIQWREGHRSPNSNVSHAHLSGRGLVSTLNL